MERLAETLADALERLFRIAFETDHDDGGRVRGAGEREAVLPLDAHAVDLDDVFGIVEVKLLLQEADEGVLAIGMCSSGVFTALGRASRRAEGSFSRERISRSRAPA